MIRALGVPALVVIGAFQSSPAAGQMATSAEPQPAHTASAQIPVVRFGSGQSAFSTYSGLVDSLRAVVRDSSAWRELWRQINRPFFPPPALPPVDFQHEMVVVAALGSRPNAGFDIQIDGAAQDSAGIEIDVRRTSPAAGCPVAAAITQPVDLARIPVSTQALRFRERRTVIPCAAP